MNQRKRLFQEFLELIERLRVHAGRVGVRDRLDGQATCKTIDRALAPGVRSAAAGGPRSAETGNRQVLKPERGKQQSRTQRPTRSEQETLTSFFVSDRVERSSSGSVDELPRGNAMKSDRTGPGDSLHARKNPFLPVVGRNGFSFSRAERIRTSDLLTPSQTR